MFWPAHFLHGATCPQLGVQITRSPFRLTSSISVNTDPSINGASPRSRRKKNSLRPAWALLRPTEALLRPTEALLIRQRPSLRPAGGLLRPTEALLSRTEAHLGPAETFLWPTDYTASPQTDGPLQIDGDSPYTNRDLSWDRQRCSLSLKRECCCLLYMCKRIISLTWRACGSVLVNAAALRAIQRYR